MTNNFNLLKEASSIKNTVACRFDSLNGYLSNFNKNGNVDGWDIYSSVCLYGAWNTILFGTSTANSSFIGRTDNFSPIPAEKYYSVKLSMKLTLPESTKKSPPTKAKLMWTTSASATWQDDKSKEFDLHLSDQWHTYLINMGEATHWIGNISNLRIYPIIDGYPDIKFAIKYIKIDSIDEFICTNTQCSYYPEYIHPCQGIGRRATIVANTPTIKFTTVTNVSDELIINIDDYGNEAINLGTNEYVSGHDMAKIIVERVSRVNAGQYSYVEATYNKETSLISISSGSMNGGSSIIVSGSAAKVLGFIDEEGQETLSRTLGETPATGFDYAASRRLKGFELNALVDSNIDTYAYYHEPTQYNVEAGRRDYADSMSAKEVATIDFIDHYVYIDGAKKIIIDYSHPINDSGRLSNIWVNGNYIYKTSKHGKHEPTFVPKVLILRPDKAGKVRILEEFDITVEDPEIRYTAAHITFKVDCDVAVEKGDLVGFYDFNVLAPASVRTNIPNAVYFEVEWAESTFPTGKFEIGRPMAQGVIGISFYARSNRIQSNIQLDIDIGKRTNIEEIQVYGKELTNDFEYNIASCLDVSWQVSCHNDTHWHYITSGCGTGGFTPYHVVHRNKYYGLECLSDSITTTDGGQIGDSYTINSQGGSVESVPGKGLVYDDDPDANSGIETFGHHSYFYVNGDAEWLNGGCGGGSPVSPVYTQGEFKNVRATIYDYEYDPITFYLLFPASKELDVYKSIMYFKEPKNFKCYSLSYYLGESGQMGNAEEPHFQFIEGFNSVVLDGKVLSADDPDGSNKITQMYSKTLFKNPTPMATLTYTDGTCSNWDVYQTTVGTNVNVLQHNFDSVACKGFKIHTTWHKSTKITELELYSKIPVKPTLLDNVDMQTSLYGDLWQELVFEEDDLNDQKIKAHVAGNPRYFRVQLQSQDPFELSELNATISSSEMKSLDCSDTILAGTAPKGEITTAKMLEVENTYDIPLNLSVDIPNQLFKQHTLVSWVKLDSESTTINSEVGPGAIVRKADDYPLYLETGQIAINTPSYYLKNLIENKQAHLFTNEHSWITFGDLAHGEDINYTNVPNGKVTTLGFLPVSSKYWKLSVHSTERYKLDNITLFHNSDHDITPVNPSDDFDSYFDGEFLPETLWEQSQTVENKQLLFSAQASNPTQLGKFFIEGDFDTRVRWVWKTKPPLSTESYWTVGFKISCANDPSNAVVLQRKVAGGGYSYYNEENYYIQDDIWTSLEKRGAGDEGGSRWKITRVADTFSFAFRYEETDVWTDLTSYDFSAIGDKVIIEFSVNSFDVSPLTEAYFDDFEVAAGVAYIGELSSEFLAVSKVDINKVYIQAEKGKGSGKHETTFNNLTDSIDPASVISYTCPNDVAWSNYWDYDLGDKNNAFTEKREALRPSIAPGQMIYVEKPFSPGLTSFELQVDFEFDFPTSLIYTIELFNSYNEVVFRMDLIGHGSDTATLELECPIPLEQEIGREASDYNYNPLIYNQDIFTKNEVDYTTGFSFILKKDYLTFTEIKLQSIDTLITYHESLNKPACTSKISKLRATYTNTSETYLNADLTGFGINSVNLIALPYLSDRESIVFEFNNSQPIDVIKFVQPDGVVEYSEVSISSLDNNDYTIWAKNFNMSSGLAIENSCIYVNDFGYKSATVNPFVIFSANLDYSLTYSESIQDQHFRVYDFGAGHECTINSMLLITGWTKSGATYFDYDDHPILRVYGANEYKSTHEEVSGFIANREFDFSVATLLSEFTINYRPMGSSETSVSFSNITEYRYYIFHWPKAPDNAEHTILIKAIELYTDYSSQSSNILMTSNQNYTNYFAIDLLNTHNLDFLRNYGSVGSPDLINLDDNTYLDYSSSDTSDITEVQWQENSPTLLLHLADLNDVVTQFKDITSSGFINFITCGSPLDVDGYLGIGVKQLHCLESTDSITTVGDEAEAHSGFTAVDMTGLTTENGHLIVKLKVDFPENIESGKIILSSATYTVPSVVWYHSFDSSGNDPLSIISRISSEYTTFVIPMSYFDYAPVGMIDVSALIRVSFLVVSKNGAITIGQQNAVISKSDTGQVTIPYEPGLALSDNDFTIDFWFRRVTTGAAGIFGQVSAAPATSSFSFIISSTNYVITTLFIGTRPEQLVSLTALSDTEWHHIALSRNGAHISFYLDGLIQASSDIGSTTKINISTEDLIIGQVAGDYFLGSVDELRMKIGTYEYVSNFPLPTEEYAVDGSLGDKTKARWIRIALLCGDGLTRHLQYLGIYPDIRFPFIQTGGYNCEWEAIEDRLSFYDIVSRNVAPLASIINTGVLKDDFNSGISDYWSNTSVLDISNIISQTGFDTDNPETFWRTTTNTITEPGSFIDYYQEAMRVFLAEDEACVCTFSTEYINGNCSCIIDYTPRPYAGTTSLETSLILYSESGYYWAIRNVYSISPRIMIIRDGTIMWSSQIDTGNVTKLKIKRVNTTITFYVYNDGWSDLGLDTIATDSEPFTDGPIYFQFEVDKASIFPQTEIHVRGVTLVDESISLTTENAWGTVASGISNSYAMGYLTTTETMEYGPIFSPSIIAEGYNIDYFEYYYSTTGIGGAGFSIIDVDDAEIYATAVDGPMWLIKSNTGWEQLNRTTTISGINSWYKVTTTFDWNLGEASTQWTDVSSGEIFTYKRELILNTNVAKCQIRGAFGGGWQKTFVDIKFDDVSISAPQQYTGTYYPSNCILGDNSLAGFGNSWGFNENDSRPTLVLDLGTTHKIDKFILYHNPEVSDTDYALDDFNIYGATTLSGSFELLVEQVSCLPNYIDYSSSHTIDPTNLRVIKLVVSKYSVPAIPVSIQTSTRDGGSTATTLAGGFLREFEIWTRPTQEALNSEDHPIICMDLLKQYDIIGHEIAPVLDSWNNSNEFYQYATHATSDPKQVSFSDSDGNTYPFYYSEEYFVVGGEKGPFEIEPEVFFGEGYYSFVWQTLFAMEVGQIVVNLVGPDNIVLASAEVNEAWLDQYNTFFIKTGGYYSIQLYSTLEITTDNWGVRNLYFTSSTDMTKWVALRRNTATNYVWDPTEYDELIDNATGIDKLNNLKMFASGSHRPTESHWFWKSNISTLEGEGQNVKEGVSALKINYPASQTVDVIEFLEGDHFGQDEVFSIKDSLSFWLYIEDISKIDTDEFSVIFGSSTGYNTDQGSTQTNAPAGSYKWDLSEVDLITGWNLIRLRFDKHSSIYAVSPISTGLPQALDFKQHVVSSFSLTIKGNGISFYLLLDGLKIERNWYYDTLSTGEKGLCLTWKDYVEIPLSGLDMLNGTLDMDLKLYSDTTGVDHFNSIASRTLFTLVDSSNNSISLSIRSGSWFEMGVGDTKTGYQGVFVDTTLVDVSEAQFNIGDTVHITLCWSSDSGSFSNSDTLRLYVNGKLYLMGKSTWQVSDSKNVLFRLGGGNTYLANSADSSGSAIFSNVKFFNYCKTNAEVTKQTVDELNNDTPNDFVQISMNNETFYNSRDEELPFEFVEVAPGEIVPIYIRVDKTNTDNLDELTGSIDIEWKVPI